MQGQGTTLQEGDNQPITSHELEPEGVKPLIGRHGMKRRCRVTRMVMCHERATQQSEAQCALFRIDRKDIGTNDPDWQAGLQPHESEIAQRPLAPPLSAVERTVKDAVHALLDVFRKRKDQFENLMQRMPMHA